MKGKLSFNKWSQERIDQGRKICTSRNSEHNDNCVYLILRLPLSVVRDYLWKEEGADSPEEFEQVWCDIYGKFHGDRLVFCHFGDFKKEDNRKHFLISPSVRFLLSK